MKPLSGSRLRAPALDNLILMTLTRSLGVMALAFSTLTYAQVNEKEAETSTVRRTAGIIQVLPKLDRLDEFIRNRSDPSQITLLRQVIVERVLAASLQVDATIAQIDNKVAQSNEVRGYLSDKKDKAVNRANLMSIASGGTLGAASAGLQLPSGENEASSIVGILAGVVSSSLASPAFERRKAGPDYSISTQICWPNCSSVRRSAIASMTRLSGAS